PSTSPFSMPSSPSQNLTDRLLTRAAMVGYLVRKHWEEGLQGRSLGNSSTAHPTLCWNNPDYFWNNHYSIWKLLLLRLIDQSKAKVPNCGVETSTSYLRAS